jgi:hypothetical protein
MKNWGYVIGSEGKVKLPEDRVKWSSYRCNECGLFYRMVDGRMHVRGCGSFNLPLDLITILGAIGETA